MEDLKKDDHTGAALIIVMSLFFLCGLSAVLNDVLIPFLQTVLSLSYLKIATLQTAFYMGYFLFSPVGGMLNTGYLAGIRFGLVFGAAGTMGIALGALWLSYLLIIGAVFLLGGGVALIQVSANPYALLMGSKESAVSRLSFTQAFTSIGTVLAPWVGAVVVLSVVSAELAVSTHRLFWLYTCLAVAWGGLLTLSLRLTLPDAKRKSRQMPLRDPGLYTGMVGIMLCVGVEVSVGSFLVKFLAVESVLGVGLEKAGQLSVIFWGGMVVGRLIGSIALRHFEADHLLMFHALIGVFLGLMAATLEGPLAAGCALALGLATSVMFPVAFSLALSGCRSQGSEVSGFLCMANIGGALIPLGQGAAADWVGIHRSFLLPACCYGFIALYAYLLFENSVLTRGDASAKNRIQV